MGFSPDTSEGLGRKTHGLFQLEIPFQDVGAAFPAAKSGPIDKATQPGEMSVNRHWKVAAMDDPLGQRRARALGHVPATDRHGESTVIPIKIWKAFCQFHK